MRFLIKYATRGRPELFKRTIRNIYQTIKTRNFIILVSADEDDSSLNTEDIRSFIVPYPEIILVYGKSYSKINAINRDMDYAEQWDVLINMSDDMMFVVPEWDEIIEKDVTHEWSNSLDWFAHYSDGYVKQALPTLSIMGYDYWKRDGYIYYPGYKSFSSDAEAMYVAMMRERYHYFGDNKVLFHHLHPSNVRTKVDETYRKNGVEAQHDTVLYWKRLNNYFGEDISNVKTIPFQEHIGKNLDLV